MPDLRFDSAPLGAVEVTPQGGLRIPATLTRTGVFPYVRPDGTIRREYRAPEDVFSPEALATLRAAPVTVKHPPGGVVTSRDWARVSVGHLGEDIRQDDDQIHVIGTVYVQDAEAIRQIQEGRLPEVSLGYTTDFVEGPGVAPDGTPYDGRQTMLRYNHAALVPVGRAGRTVGLRLDSAGHQIPEDTEPPMKIKIQGKEFEAGSPEAEAALAALEGAARRADSMDTEIRRLKAEKRATLIASVKRHVPGLEIRNDADEGSIMTDALAKLIPGFDVTGQSPDYIAGAFAAALAMLLADDTADDAAEKPGAGAAPPPAQGAGAVRTDALEFRAAQSKITPPEAGPADVARAAMIERGRSRKIVAG